MRQVFQPILLLHSRKIERTMSNEYGGKIDEGNWTRAGRGTNRTQELGVQPQALSVLAETGVMPSRGSVCLAAAREQIRLADFD